MCSTVCFSCCGGMWGDERSLRGRRKEVSAEWQVTPRYVVVYLWMRVEHDSSHWDVSASSSDVYSNAPHANSCSHTCTDALNIPLRVNDWQIPADVLPASSKSGVQCLSLEDYHRLISRTLCKWDSLNGWVNTMRLVELNQRTKTEILFEPLQKRFGVQTEQYKLLNIFVFQAF